MTHALPTVVALIDDDRTLVDILALSFEEQGYTVVSAFDGQEGLALVRRHEPDAVISDVNMPKLDGFSLCRQLRAQGLDVPLILLTARTSEIDEALGLDLGADDYVSKPFSTRVLLARVAALLRRNASRAQPDPAEAPLRLGRLELRGAELAVCFAGEPIEVTVTEFRLLEVLCSGAGRVYSRDQLLARIRGTDTFVAPRLIDTYVRRLRRKFEALDPGFAEIETVVGAGYRWRRA